MSQETIESFRRSTAAYNRGDWDAVLAALDPNVEFELTRAAPDGKKDVPRLPGRRGLWSMLHDVLGALRIDVEEVVGHSAR